MESFDKESKMKFILEELKKTDEFYSFFKIEFSDVMYGLINEFYPASGENPLINDLLQSYALEILSSTESVIDKDLNYPQYRLDEELSVMSRLVLKLTEGKHNKAFVNAVHQKAKELMVKYYEAIQDLSSIGFRLLEKNAKLYNWEFISNFYSILEPNDSYNQN